MAPKGGRKAAAQKKIEKPFRSVERREERGNGLFTTNATPHHLSSICPSRKHAYSPTSIDRGPLDPLPNPPIL